MTERLIFEPEAERTYYNGREVVFCKNCKHYNDRPDVSPRPWCSRLGFGGFGVEPEGFCAWGERKGA